MVYALFKYHRVIQDTIMQAFFFLFLTGDGTINFEEFVNMIEEHNSTEEDDNLFMIFSVFDPEHNGFIEGIHIKKALLSLTDVPIDEVDEIIQKARITDERKMSLEGKNFKL